MNLPVVLFTSRWMLVMCNLAQPLHLILIYMNEFRCQESILIQLIKRYPLYTKTKFFVTLRVIGDKEELMKKIFLEVSESGQDRCVAVKKL
jgi:hypothetical protein